MKWIIEELRYTARAHCQGKMREELECYANSIEKHSEDPLVCCVWERKFVSWYDGLKDLDGKYTIWIVLGMYMLEVRCECMEKVRVVKRNGRCWRKI